MRTGLTTSVILHATAIAFGLFTLSSPPAMPASDVESVSVDIVPMEATAQVLQGDKKAVVHEKPKPVPATEVAPVPQPKEEVKPEPVKQAEPKPTPAKEPAPTPPQDKTAAIDPQPEVKPDAVAEAITKEQPTETTQLPDSAPAPQARPKPQPAQAESAKAPERKDADKPVKEASSKPKSEDKQFNADEISALLDKRKPSGGGAKRSTQQASLGGDKDQGQKLSRSEQGALEAQLGGCWTLPAGLEGSENFIVVVRFNLDASGKLDGRPSVEKSSGNRPFDESAVRAVQKCDVAGLQVPAGKQDIWADVRVTFDPREMLGL
ncbi:energy transducer TonB [Mesorhizobium sp.]|uniref:energy transducer TonB family protein n=1 Tax=Mesorhizobium sp. TaxID=1871066 RepID=UPI001225437F|nr:energy transducer TonB [Mesorhizobium sp.]TIT01847.1 MAG: TonB family protein [Mesorhizobium sp.]